MKELKEKGITLIALVITIVILLILAGVTISIIMNDGLIEKSQKAADEYIASQQNETEILDYIDKQLKLYSSELNNINGTENKKLINNKDYTYYNPVVPVGFMTVSTTDASWEVVEDATLGKVVKGWNDGLVIEDKDGNQFVWVPVDETKVIYAKSLGEENNSNITSVDSATLQDDTLPSGVKSEETQINTYQGFYIARYEAGIPSTLTSALGEGTANDTARDVDTAVPVSKKNQTPWNYISYKKAKTNAEKMYTGTEVKSGLVTGTMWDVVMNWIENSGEDVQTDSGDWGNYVDAPVTGITEYSPRGNEGATWTLYKSSTKPTTGTTDAEYKWILKTGHSEYTKRKNIYDLAGNLWEWTSEIYSSYRVPRGGCYYDNGSDRPAAYRGINSMSNAIYDTTGFRVALYIQ